MNCPMCGSEVEQGTKFCPICGASVANQQAPQQVQQSMEPQMPQAEKRPKKKKKNVAIKIIAVVMALVILAGSGLFLVDSIMFKKEVEAQEIITDFPILKQRTDFLVYDEEIFPSTHYKITVERISGGVLKSEAFRQTKVIIEDISTEPVYNIDFGEDGEYIITLEDIPEETTTKAETTTVEVTTAEVTTESATEAETAEPLVVVIRVKVEDASQEAIDKVSIDSKKGDEPIEITTAKTDEDNEELPSVPKFVNCHTISAGYGHTVGVRTDGTVVAVGDNEYGQCDVSGWKDIVAVSAGDSHTVGLKSDGTVVAVGWNDDGPCDVSDWKDIVAVSAGDVYTVGLKSDGTVVAVGDNEYGQCDTSGWTDIVAVSAGGNHTVGLKSDGTVVAVGYNKYGQCDAGGWKDIVAVSAGYEHTVGLKSDGTVVAVGDNYCGECDIDSWKNIVAVSAGYEHTVGLKSDGTVVAVGSNDFGKCDVSGWRDIRLPGGNKPTGNTTTNKPADKPDTEEKPAVDAYTRDAGIYTSYLADNSIDLIGEYWETGDIEVGSCMVDMDSDGTHELLILFRDMSSCGPRGYETYYYLFTIKNGSVSKLEEAYYGGGSGGGEDFSIKYDSIEQEHIIMSDDLSRSGVSYSYWTCKAYKISAGKLDDYFNAETSTSADYDYEEGIRAIKNETSLYYDDGYSVTWYKVNGNYVTEEEFEEAQNRFVAPTDSAYQMKKGTYSNPLGL